MNDYKRIVSYLYYYGNREKKNNVGYVRMERKAGICKVTIHMRSINSNDKKLGVYFFYRRKEQLVGISLGTMVIRKGVGEFRKVLEEEMTKNLQVTLEELGGVIIYENNEHFFATQWDDELIDIMNFYIADTKQEHRWEYEEEKEELKAADLMGVEMQEIEDREEAAGKIEKENKEEKVEGKGKNEDKEEREEGKDWNKDKAKGFDREEKKEDTGEEVTGKEKKDNEREETAANGKNGEEWEGVMGKGKNGDKEEAVLDGKQGDKEEEVALNRKNGDKEEEIALNRKKEEKEEKIALNVKKDTEEERGENTNVEQKRGGVGEIDINKEKYFSGNEKEQQEIQKTESCSRISKINEAIENFSKRTDRKLQSIGFMNGRTSKHTNFQSENGKGSGNKCINMQEKQEELWKGDVKERNHVGTQMVQEDIEKTYGNIQKQNNTEKTYENIQKQNDTEKAYENIQKQNGMEKTYENIQKQNGMEKTYENIQKQEYIDKKLESRWRQQVRNQQRRLEQSMELAEKLFQKFPKVELCNEDAFKKCVKIEPQDIGNFPMETWVLANNSFMLHGYYQYRYLIFALHFQEGQWEYVIGVPGIYEPKERFMAEMFGFGKFCPTSRKEKEIGTFGYWYQVIHL